MIALAVFAIVFVALAVIAPRYGADSRCTEAGCGPAFNPRRR